MATGNGEEATLDLEVHCLCQAQRFTAQIPRSSLPLGAIYCHCTSCRRVTGALYSTYVPWPGDSERIGVSSLSRYALSPHVALLSCDVCGTTVFAETRQSDGTPNYGVPTGVLPNAAVAPGLVNILHHIFVGDTLDGGATPWLCDANSDGSRPRLWRGHRARSDELSSTAHHWPAATASTSSLPSDIPVRCHCGGVDLVLRQPTAAFAAMERSVLPWFVDPASNKLHAGFDACDSCRLSSGSDIFHWTFVLLSHLAFAPKPESPTQPQTRTQDFPSSTSELKSAVTAHRDPRWGTLAMHESSPGVQRYFCSRCSARIFYAADDRPEMVDLAIGLLDCEEGARAERLLTWDFGGKMVWRQDVVGGWREGFVERVEAAAERWRIEQGYPKNWRRVQKEEAAARG